MISIKVTILKTDGDGNNKISSDPTNLDTDFDGFNDSLEVQLGSNPLVNEDSDGDGLQDVDEINGIETKWGLVKTMANVSDTDGDGLSDYEEVYGLRALYPTHPLFNDTDSDGLLDSAEIYSISRNLGKRVQLRNLGLHVAQKSAFYFPQAERAQSAQLTVSINAGEGIQAKKLVYSVYINGMLLYTSDPPVFNESYHSKIIDVKELVEDKHPLGYGGKWEIVISTNYACLLDEFSLDVSAFLNPVDADTDNDGIMDGTELTPELNRGWVTNPMRADTDADGWNDHYEIHVSDTNPLLTDTDADGVIDSRDMAPKHDIIVKVTINTARMALWKIFSDPILQVTLKNLDTQAGIYSTRKQSYYSSDKDWWSKYCVAAWGVSANDFYFDVDDDDRSLPIDGRVFLNVFDGLFGDLSARVLASTFYYDPAYVGKSQVMTAIDTDGDYLSLTFTSLGIPRVNTIVVYENGTYSPEYGRYHSQEAMVIVQLDLTAASGHWQAGSNVILLLKSAFVNTKLNSMIQKSVDDNGAVNWSIMPDCLKINAEIVGLDRQNAGATTSKWIELMILKKSCTPAEANAILTLLLTGLINETTGEEGIIHEHDANAAHVAELMNLARDILIIVPMKNLGYANEIQGTKPLELGAWFMRIVEGILALITWLIVAIGNFLAAIAGAALKAGLLFLKAVQAVAMAVIEVIVKGAVLAFIWAMYAQALFANSTVFLIIGIIMIIFIQALQGTGKVGLSNIELSFENNVVKYERNFKWRYYKTLDLEIPFTEDILLINGIVISNTKTGILDGYYEEESHDFSEDIINNTQTKILSISDIDYEDYNDYYNDVIYIGAFITITLIIAAAVKDLMSRLGSAVILCVFFFYCIWDMLTPKISFNSENKKIDKAAAFLGMAAACAIIALSYCIALLTTNSFYKITVPSKFAEIEALLGIVVVIMILIRVTMGGDFEEPWLIHIGIISSLAIIMLLVAKHKKEENTSTIKGFDSFVFTIGIFTTLIGIIGVILAIVGYLNL